MARLIRIYGGSGEEGAPPDNLLLILKMRLVAYLYDVPERQTEAM